MDSLKNPFQIRDFCIRFHRLNMCAIMSKKAQTTANCFFVIFHPQRLNKLDKLNKLNKFYKFNKLYKLIKLINFTNLTDQ